MYLERSRCASSQPGCLLQVFCFGLLECFPLRSVLAYHPSIFAPFSAQSTRPCDTAWILRKAFWHTRRLTTDIDIILARIPAPIAGTIEALNRPKTLQWVLQSWQLRSSEYIPGWLHQSFSLFSPLTRSQQCR